MSEIEKNLTIAAPIDRVWAALTDPNVIREWMLDDEVQVDLRLAGDYAFFDRQTIGEFIEITPPTALEYTWRQIAWPPEYADSLVRWDLGSDGVVTYLRLIHSNFPNDDERNAHDAGWDMYWLEPMQEWLESG